MARNYNLLKCDRYKVEIEHAFDILVRIQEINRQHRIIRAIRRNGDTQFRNITNRWFDPDYWL